MKQDRAHSIKCALTKLSFPSWSHIPAGHIHSSASTQDVHKKHTAKQYYYV